MYGTIDDFGSQSGSSAASVSGDEHRPPAVPALVLESGWRKAKGPIFAQQQNPRGQLASAPSSHDRT